MTLLYSYDLLTNILPLFFSGQSFKNYCREVYAVINSPLNTIPSTRFAPFSFIPPLLITLLCQYTLINASSSCPVWAIFFYYNFAPIINDRKCEPFIKRRVCMQFWHHSLSVFRVFRFDCCISLWLQHSKTFFRDSLSFLFLRLFFFFLPYFYFYSFFPSVFFLFRPSYILSLRLASS